MTTKPPLDHGQGVGLLLGGHWPATLDTVPFRQASPATRGRRVLGDEHRMPAHRRLLAVVRWRGRREALGNERPRVLEHRGQPLLLDVSSFSRPEVEALPELGPAQRSEEIVQRSHGLIGRHDAERRARFRGRAAHILGRPTSKSLIERPKARALPGREILLRTVELQPQRVGAVGDQLAAVALTKLERRYRGKCTNRSNKSVNHASVIVC